MPDCSASSKNLYGRFAEGDVLRRLFESVVEKCIGCGLVAGADAVIDSSTNDARAKDIGAHPEAYHYERAAFAEKIAQYERDNRPLVWIDESGFATDLPRTHGYSARGKRCFGARNWHARGRTNALCALLAGALLTVGLTVGLTQANVTFDIFNLWLKQNLIPKLPDGCVLVMDNASFHKRSDRRTAIEAEGHSFEYLPPYSPDLSRGSARSGLKPATGSFLRRPSPQ